MKTPIDELFEKNKAWSDEILAEDPSFFERLEQNQTPEYLWIGCSDSRVPANAVVGLAPGELFVHRNIANCVVHTDLNCLSVIYYAIRVLKVKSIIVTGHYGCGGVSAAMSDKQFGLADHWIRNIRDVYNAEREELAKYTDRNERLNRLCELNVLHQVANVSHLPAVQHAWHEGVDLTIHGWIYDLHNGRLKKIAEPISSADELDEEYRIRRFIDQGVF